MAGIVMIALFNGVQQLGFGIEEAVVGAGGVYHDFTGIAGEIVSVHIHVQEGSGRGQGD